MTDIRPVAVMAWRNLARTKIRTFLTALGVTIAVVAIASLGMLGGTLQAQATQNLGGIGNEIIITPAEESDERYLTERQLREIDRVARNARVVRVIEDQNEFSFGRDSSFVQTYYFQRIPGSYDIVEGDVPVPLRSSALVGEELADQFGIEPGNSVTVNGTTYRVRAIVASGGSLFSPVSPDNAVIVPREQRDDYSRVVVTAESGEEANETATAIRSSLNSGREQSVVVRELSEVIDNINEFFGTLNTFLIGLGAISLVVAGVSILNVMLMSVVERREEIGVLRAVGFQKRDVLKIILMEAILLGTLGGVIGVIFSVGVGLAVGVVALGDMSVVLTADILKYPALGFVFGVVTSLVCGLYPAWKAANEHPVEALRS